MELKLQGGNEPFLGNIVWHSGTPLFLNGNKKDKSGQLLIYALVIHIILLSQKFL
jgi:hypothetical protein